MGGFVIVLLAAASVGTAQEAPSSGSETEESSESLVTNSFFDTDIRQALSDVAAETGVTIIVDDSVLGYITLVGAQQLL